MLDIRFTLPVAALIPPALVAALILVGLARGRRLPGLILVWQLLLVAYVTGLVGATFFPFQVSIGEYAGTAEWWNAINAVPIATIDARTFLLNILLTAPLGVFLPVLTRWRSAPAVLTAGLIVSLGIEILQYVLVRLLSTGRTADVNDLIANVLGVGLGYLALRLALRRTGVARWIPDRPVRKPAAEAAVR